MVRVLMMLTTVMSLGFRVLRLLIADCSAGIASARSFSQSSLGNTSMMIWEHIHGVDNDENALTGLLELQQLLHLPKLHRKPRSLSWLQPWITIHDDNHSD